MTSIYLFLIELLTLRRIIRYRDHDLVEATDVEMGHELQPRNVTNVKQFIARLSQDPSACDSTT
jgi:hypothetical protein